MFKTKCSKRVLIMYTSVLMSVLGYVIVVILWIMLSLLDKFS